MRSTRVSSTLAGAIATSGTPPPGRGVPGCNGACQCALSAQSGSPCRFRRCGNEWHLRAAACRQTRCVAPVWLGEALAWSRATCLWHSVITVCVKVECIHDFIVFGLASSISGVHHSILVLPQNSARFIRVAFASAFVIIYSCAPQKRSGSHSHQLPRRSGNTPS